MAMGESASPSNFIRNIIDEHNRNGRFGGKVETRFPPEPNGYLHIGHAKSICLNFGLAADYGGVCHLRFDDTNPAKEEQEYLDSIIEDVRWLGFDWGEHLYYASNYFDQLYEFALKLIKGGKAYVDDLSAEEIRAHRGTLTEPGKDSPYRGRGVEENLDLFQRMKAGEFADGSRVLRAKIDMAHPNLVMRDPTLYRIRRAVHHRTGDKWCIYPMYDFTHCISDSIEGITHSICTLEFEDNRVLYDWVLDQLDIYHPQQIEFARLNLEFAVMSKRKLLGVGQGRLRGRLGRPAHAHHPGHAPPGLHPRVGAPVLRAHRGGQKGIVDRHVLAGKGGARRSQRKGPPGDGRAGPPQGGDHQLPRGPGGGFRGSLLPGQPSGHGISRRALLPRAIHRPRRFHGRPTQEVLAPGSGPRGAPALGLSQSPARRWSRTIKGNIVELRCTYDPETKGGWAPDERKVKGHPALGVGPPRPKNSGAPV